jgi:pyrroloquinoline quinone (PQQ) biosynthesis protein C
VNEFLSAPDGSWAGKMLEELIFPAQAENLKHRFFAELNAGSLPISKVARWAKDMLWITVRFPEIIAAMAARCPAYDHLTKSVLLENAYSERLHPPMMAKLIAACGDDPDLLLNGPMHLYRASRHSEAIVDFLTAYAFHHSFSEAICAIGSMEAMTPKQCKIVHDALLTKYGIAEADLEWLSTHLGEVEQQHAAAALSIADSYIGRDDNLRGRCEYAVQRGVYLAGAFPEMMYFEDSEIALV